MDEPGILSVCGNPGCGFSGASLANGIARNPRIMEADNGSTERL
jgi:hypothetical protein